MMKYCQFDGCTTKIPKGRYCQEHQRSEKSSKSKAKKKTAYHHENKPFYRTDAWKDNYDYVYEREKGHCQHCGRIVFGRQAHRHHVIPIKKNPLLKLDPNNIRLLCPQCHVIEENEDDNKKVFPNYFS